MRTFLRTIAILSFVIFAGACSEKNEDYTPVSLEVTPHNISGYWVLTEFNGTKIPEGAYCYIEYIRKDRKFIMYQKFDSMYPRRITGLYSIEKDKKKGYVLSGTYDYGMGEWNRYLVTALHEDHMILKTESNENEVCRYERCNEIPADILEQAK